MKQPPAINSAHTCPGLSPRNASKLAWFPAGIAFLVRHAPDVVVHGQLDACWHVLILSRHNYLISLLHH